MTCFGGSFQIRYVIMRQKYCGLNQYTLTVQVHFLPHLPESCFVCWALKRVTNAAAKLGVIANELCKCYAAPDVCFFFIIIKLFSSLLCFVCPCRTCPGVSVGKQFSSSCSGGCGESRLGGHNFPAKALVRLVPA